MRNAIYILTLLTFVNAGIARAQTETPATESPRRGAIAEDAETAEVLEAQKGPPRLFAKTEFMIWWIRSPNFPALVTQGEASGPTPGSLDSPYTQTVFGGSTMRFQDRPGGRFSGSYWFDEESTLGVEASYFFIGGRGIDRSYTSPGNPVLAVPFFNVNNGGIPDSSLVAYPGIMRGGIVVSASSFLQGAETNLNVNLWQSDHIRLEALAGLRYLHLRESLSMNSVSFVQLSPQYVGMGIPYDGNTIIIDDQFVTRSTFYGGQVGARMDITRKRFTLGLLGKIALGCSRSVVSINGSTSIDTLPTTTVNAGVLALSSNSGQYSSSSIAFVPEVGMSLKFQLTEHIALFGGYSFLYFSKVARPGDQVDSNVNVNLVPTSKTFGLGGVDAPAFRMRHTDFFAHGANFGVEFRY